MRSWSNLAELYQLCCQCRVSNGTDLLSFSLVCRAAYCRNAIAISLSIKNNFHRYLPSQGDTNIVQYIIPYPMPAHMMRASYPPVEYTNDSAESEKTLQCFPPVVTPRPMSPVKRIGRAAPTTLVQPRRVKRAYNKKSTSPQKPSPCYASSGIVAFASSLLDTTEIDTPTTMYTPRTSPEREIQSLPCSLIGVTAITALKDEASSDSGTDDEFFCKYLLISLIFHFSHSLTHSLTCT